jgi:multidrug efflux pump
VQRADRPYASFYLSFSSAARDVPAITDWLTRTLQPQLSTLPGVQRVTVEGGRQIAMRVWIDPDRLAAVNLAPGDVHAALRRNNYLAAVGQTKGELVQVNLLANTDLRSVEEFNDLIVADRGGAWCGCATWRASSSGRRRRTWSPSSTARRRCTSACGRSSA